MRILALLLLLVALGGRTALAQAGGKALYDQRCAACHGGPTEDRPVDPA